MIIPVRPAYAMSVGLARPPGAGRRSPAPVAALWVAVVLLISLVSGRAAPAVPLTDAQLRAIILPVADGARLPPDWKLEGELIDHDSLTGWLLAYWEGSWRVYW